MFRRASRAAPVVMTLWRDWHGHGWQHRLRGWPLARGGSSHRRRRPSLPSIAPGVLFGERSIVDQQTLTVGGQRARARRLTARTPHRIEDRGLTLARRGVRPGTAALTLQLKQRLQLLARELHAVLATDVDHDEMHAARQRMPQRLARAQLTKLQRAVGVAPTEARRRRIQHIHAREQRKRALPLAIRQSPRGLILPRPRRGVDRTLRQHHQRIYASLLTSIRFGQHSPECNRRLVDSPCNAHLPKSLPDALMAAPG